MQGKIIDLNPDAVRRDLDFTWFMPPKPKMRTDFCCGADCWVCKVFDEN